MSSNQQQASPSDAGWLTIPNAITLLRFLLLGPVIWMLADGPETLSVVLLLTWALTDWVDGLLARALNQTSRVGAIFDPIADRIGIAGIFLAIALAGLLPWWPLIIIAVVDLVVVLVASRAAMRGSLAVSYVGKARTAVLMAGVFGLCAVAAWAPQLITPAALVVLAGVALHVIAGAGYVLAAARPPAVESGREPTQVG